MSHQPKQNDTRIIELEISLKEVTDKLTICTDNLTLCLGGG